MMQNFLCTGVKSRIFDRFFADATDTDSAHFAELLPSVLQHHLLSPNSLLDCFSLRHIEAACFFCLSFLCPHVSGHPPLSFVQCLPRALFKNVHLVFLLSCGMGDPS